jgi:GAF domain-containing protein
MAALALPQVTAGRYYIRQDLAIIETETDYTLLLDAVLSQIEAQTATIYLLDSETSDLAAIAGKSNLEAHIKDVGVTLSGATTRWLNALAGPVHGRPAEEPHFEKFPEALLYRAQRLAIVPLRADDKLLGLLTLGRIDESPFTPAQLELAARAGRLLAALLERETLRRKLAERKLVERAKGILQRRRRLSEEEAYLMLRNNSRRRRIPMAELAREIIALSVPAAEAVPGWQTA